MTPRSRQLCNLLLILAFATMGISPACHFISGGDGLIEICTADGEIKQITLAEAGLPPSPVKPHQAKQLDCMFCVAGGSAKLGTAGMAFLALMPGANYLHNGRGSFVPKARNVSFFDARGPPALLT